MHKWFHSMPLHPTSIAYMLVTGHPLEYGMRAYSYRKPTTKNIANGYPVLNFKPEPKDNFICTVSRFRRSVTSTCFARDAAMQAIRKGIKSARYPYKTKHHFPTKWAKDGFKIYENGTIQLSMGIHEGKRERPILVHIRRIPVGHIKEIELCYDRGLYLAISYEDGIANKVYQKQQSVGIDLGEIHTMTAFVEQGESLMVTGRKMRATHRLRNKKLAEIQRLQSKCTKGSRQWKKYERAKRYIRAKSEKQLRDQLHKSTRNVVDWCIQQAVSDVYLGEVEGVQRDTRKKKRVNRKQAQKLSNWSFGKVRQYLQYKLEQQGIRLHLIHESYTSQTCPVCQKRTKVSSRNFRSPCGYTEHRDVLGARNILSKGLYGDIRHFDVETKTTYLRIA